MRKVVAIKSSEKLFVTSLMRWTVNVPQRLVLGETCGLESSTPYPDGHFKFPRLWSPKFPQAGRFNYGVLAASRVSLAAASFSR